MLSGWVLIVTHRARSRVPDKHHTVTLCLLGSEPQGTMEGSVGCPSAGG